MYNDNDTGWDKMIYGLKGHLFQSSLWKSFQNAQGRDTIQDSGDGWAWLGTLRKSSARLNYLYIAYGPCVTGDKAFQKALDCIIGQATSKGVAFIRMDLVGSITPGAIRQARLIATTDFQPSHQMVLNLKPSLDELWSNVSGSQRNLVNTAPKKGLEFMISSQPADLARFLAMQADTTKRQGIAAHPDSYYQALLDSLGPSGACKIYFAKHQEGYVAGSICVDWQGIRYYLLAATDHHLNTKYQGASALLWWLIKDAKEQGNACFNYGGVVPLDWEHHPWIGHTKFKHRFGGEIIETLGTWDLPLKKGQYQLYKLAKGLKK